VTRADRLSEPVGATTHYAGSAPARSGRFRLPSSIAFAVAAVAFTSVLATAGTPAPLYVVYQERFHIPDAGLTAAFAIYILAVVAVLLCGGRLSDHVGRRPVAVLAPVLGLAACLVFMHVQGLGALLLGRGLQGLATSALAAFLLDLHPPGRLLLAASVTSAGPSAGGPPARCCPARCAVRAAPGHAGLRGVRGAAGARRGRAGAGPGDQPPAARCAALAAPGAAGADLGAAGVPRRDLVLPRGLGRWAASTRRWRRRWPPRCCTAPTTSSAGSPWPR
jgi:MFS family permease